MPVKLRRNDDRPIGLAGQPLKRLLLFSRAGDVVRVHGLDFLGPDLVYALALHLERGRELSGVDAEGAMTSRQMVLYCLALVCASLGPVMLGTVSGFYVAGALGGFATEVFEIRDSARRASSDHD